MRSTASSSIPARPLIRSTFDHAVAFNRSERREDEWFDEPDDLERVQRAIDSNAGLHDVVEAARGPCLSTCAHTVIM